ncbi:complex I subunit 5 family protein [Gluconacetobacter tumulisoli]|uniref:NADH-quinone oxidoreductase subunit E n=1 Tax=Gluconacetobacter tumulisoli TaxID=1286189 RepID=A0A7W4KAC6_9PROT|nr:proton-conducting transporter membrane subunit [Gluconacetobacter tumulisoli]MBB2203277.1 NADH-quinone oxidoreductase subunit E [Gluconacetobacter tumulisoli]
MNSVFADPAAWPICIVAGLLTLAGVLLAGAKIVPTLLSDIVTLAATAIAGGMAAVLAMRIGDHPALYWMGGWTPRQGQAIGIAFLADRAGAGATAFAGLMFTVAIWFARGHFAGARNHFHVLMLLFLASQCGFFFAHDLFDMFVWFEMMSVAGFALTGYALRSPSLDGALNFTILNTIGAYLILMGIALAYARANALDFSAVRAIAQGQPDDPLLIAAFVLITTGFLTKAAQVPFHFWLPDAHAVAPSPVSAIFSGIMVSVGLFGVARMVWEVFAPCPVVRHLVHVGLMSLGCGSAVMGAVMALMQRHVKRMLAFSTVSHVGVALIGVGLLGQQGLGGSLLYLAGHGLIKAVLFMIAGIMLSTLGGIDEIGLRGAGRPIWPAGIVMGACALVLAGIPIGPLDAGAQMMDAQARSSGLHGLTLVIGFAGALTGGAVLRVTGRVFFNLGPTSGEEDAAPTDDEREHANRPFAAQLVPVLALLAVWVLFGIVFASGAEDFALAAARDMTLDADFFPRRGLPHVTPVLPWLPALIAMAIASADLNRHHIPDAVYGAFAGASRPAFRMLQAIHDGVIGEYVLWMMAGLVFLAGIAILGC